MIPGESSFPAPESGREQPFGETNPLRYRGYYYDSESGFYYLNSRYYDPGTGRFLNADWQMDENAGLFQKETCMCTARITR